MFSYGRAHWHHLANTIAPSVCGDNAALCQITLCTVAAWYAETMSFTVFVGHAVDEIWQVDRVRLAAHQGQDW